MLGTTVISPNLAIPHIIVEGQHIFDVLIARCRDGIVFTDSARGVQAVFVLAGSLDERNTHLRALAAIAQIAQDPEFDARWLRAKTAEDLRDVLLLSERKREEIL
jgi:mannitol/fructose-specific phosphotransferase system IIA component (Ntr-type)